ncbi:MAG: hypothetical protein AAB871_02185, partial [Patescibacteria group bacterium]
MKLWPRIVADAKSILNGSNCPVFGPHPADIRLKSKIKRGFRLFVYCGEQKRVNFWIYIKIQSAYAD